MRDSRMRLWEIMVPTIRNDGRFIHTRFHRVWDAKVREIASGLTIMPVAKGQWVNESGDLFAERMIPVRVACSDYEMNEILAMTKDYYEQEAIFAYLISEMVRIYK